MIFKFFADTVPCSANDFEWYYDPYYGNCFRFNSGKNASGEPQPELYANQPGNSGGLKL